MDKEKPPSMGRPANGRDDVSETLIDNSDELSIEPTKEQWQPPCVEKIAELAEQHGFIAG